MRSLPGLGPARMTSGGAVLHCAASSLLAVSRRGARRDVGPRRAQATRSWRPRSITARTSLAWDRRSWAAYQMDDVGHAKSDRKASSHEPWQDTAGHVRRVWQKLHRVLRGLLGVAATPSRRKTGRADLLGRRAAVPCPTRDGVESNTRTVRPPWARRCRGFPRSSRSSAWRSRRRPRCSPWCRARSARAHWPSPSRRSSSRTRRSSPSALAAR